MTTTIFARISRTALVAALPLAIACTSDARQSEGESSVPCAECDAPDAAPPSPADAAVPAPDADAEPPPPVCGDGVCDTGEECEVDCCNHVCGDGMCAADEECPEDCDDECTDCCHPEDECCGSDCTPEEETGCTLTQGYWKTHNEHATSPGLQADWPAPYNEDDLLCAPASESAVALEWAETLDRYNHGAIGPGHCD